MHDKRICLTCIHHCRLIGGVKKPDPHMSQTVMCAYCLDTHQTCLTHTGEDRRGNDPKHCKLYVNGVPKGMH